MNKLVFKLFHQSGIFLLLIVVTFLLSSCMPSITGRSAQIPNETSQYPEVYFCPADDCSKVFENHIKVANSTVHCALYDIDLKNVINSLSSKSRNADVKVVIDNSNNSSQIKGNGLRMSTGGQLMHNKFCAIDNKIVLTGSFNPTYNDNNRNNNNVMVIYSKTLAGNYEDEFEELWNGEFGKGKAVKNQIMYVNDIEIENYFCPEDCSSELSSSITKDSGLNKIIELIKNAKKSIQVASYTFSNEKIADELIKARGRGVNVTIITESKQKNVQGSQYQRVKDFGLNIRLDGNKYNMHHKFMVVDGKIVETGSPNFTLAGFNKNDENMLIIHDKGISLKYLDEFNGVFDSGK